LHGVSKRINKQSKPQFELLCINQTKTLKKRSLSQVRNRRAIKIRASHDLSKQKVMAKLKPGDLLKITGNIYGNKEQEIPVQ